MYVCMYVCMNACMHACMHVCMYIYIYIYCVLSHIYTRAPFFIQSFVFGIVGGSFFRNIYSGIYGWLSKACLFIRAEPIHLLKGIAIPYMRPKYRHPIRYSIISWTIFLCIMMTISNGNIFRVTAGNSPVTVNSSHKGQWRGALMFSLISAWIND